MEIVVNADGFHAFPVANYFNIGDEMKYWSIIVFLFVILSFSQDNEYHFRGRILHKTTPYYPELKLSELSKGDSVGISFESDAHCSKYALYIDRYSILIIGGKHKRISIDKLNINPCAADSRDTDKIWFKIGKYVGVKVDDKIACNTDIVFCNRRTVDTGVTCTDSIPVHGHLK